MPSLMGADVLEPTARETLEAAVRDELAASFPSDEWTLMPADLLGLTLESKGLNPAACADESCFSDLGRQADLDIPRCRDPG